MIGVRKVAPLLSLSLLGLALALGGCSKKAAPELPNPDTTQNQPTVPKDPTPKEPIDNGGDVPVPMSLNDVFFDYDAFALRSDARRVIDENGNTINANPDWRVITLEGHCDERGTTEYNLALGERRALAPEGEPAGRPPVGEADLLSGAEPRPRTPPAADAGRRAPEGARATV